MNKVAIIGAGPAGLSAARWLVREGFDPILIEQGDTLGGQWSGDPRYSGIWPSMHTADRGPTQSIVFRCVFSVLRRIPTGSRFGADSQTEALLVP